MKVPFLQKYKTSEDSKEKRIKARHNQKEDKDSKNKVIWAG
jgi:hypothetical protein